ncbi:zinc finger protein Xfin [Aplysia californica]|uniref:Zinc finger protein Xfin n=1 Tax=Aplysia californica TaxID=6500 RepID=A0ABM0K4M7_APLCA|nr:zinc finger protein Xfin [Aplysia californica]
MAQPDVGPNDIVIHLVNPYKCASCGTEFFLRSMLLEHLGEHIEKQKAQNPCSQVVCGVSLAEHTDNGITVTRDILQINEHQMFELQDPTLDYSQLAPLKALEQAGILSLPPKPQVLDRPQGKKDSSALSQPFVTDGIGGVSRNKISLLKQSPLSLLPREPTAHVQMEVLDPSIITGHVEDQITAPTDIISIKPTSVEPNIADLDSIVQQTLFCDGRIKGEYSVMIEAPPALSGQLQAEGDIPQIFVSDGQENFASPLEGGDELSGLEEKSILGKKKKRPVCPVCHNEFSNQNALERHQVVHTGEKPHRCLVCFKQFNDVSSLRKHSLIHKRQHRCPICHRLYLRKVQLVMHMKHHGKKRFIQFGNTFHEVKVKSSRNEHGQMVQEFSLSMLLGEDEKREVEQSGTEAVAGGKEAVDGVKQESEGKENDGQVDEKAENVTEEGTMLEAAEKGTVGSVAGDVVGEGSDFVVAPSGKDQQGPEELHMKKKSVIYKCGHCKKMIFTRPTLSRHLIRHTNKRPFVCERCSKSFRDKADLVHHYKTHTKPVKCPTCTAAFSKPLYLEKHLQKGCPVMDHDSRFTVLEDLRCQCNLCGKILKSKTNVIRHLRVHAFDDRVKAGGLKTEGDLTPTIPSSETAEPPSLLENSAGLSENVEDHYRPLENSVGFSCLICGLEFRFRSFMKTHILMHLNVRPFKCPQCSKSFYARHMLKKHLQNHTRPYTCPVCNKGFIRRYLMRKHFKKKHEDGEGDDMQDITVLEQQKMILCNICGKTMHSFQKSLMRYHVRMHKDVRPFECTECPKKFSSEHALKKHSLNHKKPYVCQVCGKGFSRRYLLMSHFKKQCKHLMKEENETSENNDSVTPARLEDAGEEGDAEENAEDGQQPDPTPYQPTVITTVSIETGKERYICQPCDKPFMVYEALIRHMNTFARPTACRHCGKVFEDKHLTKVHQRSCLGVLGVIKGSGITPQQSRTSASLGLRQEKVQRIRTAVKKTIDSVTAGPATAENDAEVCAEGETVTESAPNQVSQVSEVQDQSSQDQASEVSEVSAHHPAGADGVLNDSASAAESRKEVVQRTLVVLKEKKGRFTCPECSKTFGTPRGLKIHANSHLRLYKCETCDKDFSQVASLRAHSLTHKEQGRDTQSSSNLTQEFSSESKENAAQMGKERAGVEEAEVEPSTPVSRWRGKNKMKKTRVEEERKSDSDDDLIAERSVEHKDLVGVSQRLMQSGTRGRPFSCKMCRRRFTEQPGLESHMLQIHGVRMLS